MVRRRGIGATLVASVVFSVLLVAGLAVYTASQNRADLYSVADAENALSDEFIVQEASGGMNMLIAVQGFVANHPLPCSSAAATISGALTTLGGEQVNGGLKVVSSAVLVDLQSSDNLTAFSPFDGATTGSLDLAVTSHGDGMAGEDVSFDRTETHYVHLDVRILEASGLCLDEAASVNNSLGSSAVSNCTYDAVGPLVEESFSGLAQQGESEGFSSGVDYSLVSTQPCRIAFTVTVTQSGIPGPEGEFSARFVQGGFASVGTTA
jgi:hypothetical protein